jgi:DNA processing protein
MSIDALVRFSALSEPGDGLAGLILQLRGAEQALEDYQSGRAPTVWRDLVEEYQPEYQSRLPELLERFALRWPAAAPAALIDAACRVGARPISRADAPELWQRFEALGWHQPTLLWLAGTKPDVTASVSVVGTRRASGYGHQVTRELVGRLVGCSVVSGGAIGIDAIAHQTALDGNLPTVAYLAGGINRAYPAKNQGLFHRVVREGGALLSEVAPGTNPSKWRFLQRNRLIAAHSQITVVVEAGYRSGARNTAGQAIACGRRLFAVPGPITASSSSGCNLMIAERLAEPLVSIDGFIKSLFGSAEFEAADSVADPEGAHGQNFNQVRLLDSVRSGRRTLSEICLESGLDTLSARLELSRLEALGTVTYSAGGWRLAD